MDLGGSWRLVEIDFILLPDLGVQDWFLGLDWLSFFRLILLFLFFGFCFLSLLFWLICFFLCRNYFFVSFDCVLNFIINRNGSFHLSFTTHVFIIQELNAGSTYSTVHN